MGLLGAVLLLSSLWCLPAAGVVELPRRRATVVLVLGGARLGELADPARPVLSGLVRRASGAWIAGRSDVALPPGTRLPIPPCRDPARPYGVAADGTRLALRARNWLETREMLVIQPGDMERAEEYAPLCLPAKAREHRQAALESADRLLKVVWADVRVGELWLLAPRRESGPGLAPVFRMRRGSGPGLLRSGSTHMTGVVTAADVAATLAARGGDSLKPGSGYPRHGAGGPLLEDSAGLFSGVGRRLTVVASPAAGESSRALEELRRIGALAERSDRLRAVANRGVQWLLLVLVGAGILALRARKGMPLWLTLVPLLLPPLLLADGAHRGGEPLLALALLLLPLSGLAGAFLLSKEQGRHGGDVQSGDPARLVEEPQTRRASWKSPPVMAVVALAAAAALAFSLSLLFGDVFRWAVLGYSIRLGVRFYGVGNEHMGWWVGAALLAVGLPRGDRPRLWAVAVLVVTAALIGHPGFGADVGGGVTALAAAGVEMWPALRRRPGAAAGTLVIAGTALLALAVWDALRLSDLQTHLGRLAARVASEGPGPFLSLAAGKVLTNLRISVSLWGVLLAAGLWLVWEARRRASEEKIIGLVGRLVPVAAVAFLANDSGVIAAALMLSYGVVAAGGAKGVIGRGEANLA